MKSVYILWFTVILTFGIYSVYSGELPAEIKKCKSTNNDECVAKITEEIVRLYPYGNPAFGMPNIKAYNLTTIYFSQKNPNSPVQVNFKFKNSTVYGLDEIKMLSVNGFNKNMKKIKAETLIPNQRIRGDYESEGKILLLPLNGRGKGEIFFKNLKMFIDMEVEIEKRNDNKNYVTIKHLKMTTDPELMITNLENIIKDNKILSDSINGVINENWRDVWSEIQNDVNHLAETFTKFIMDNVFNELSMDDFFAD
ncbi:protein takeout-like [Cochliomyia hominivorax]